MFENVDKFKELKRREENLSKQLEDLEIKLKEQETREELNKAHVDETTKKIREQIQISYDHLQNQNEKADDQQPPDSHDDSKQQESGARDDSEQQELSLNEDTDYVESSSYEIVNDEDSQKENIKETRNNIVSRIVKKSVIDDDQKDDVR